jgi:hypothetical protein
MHGTGARGRGPGTRVSRVRVRVRVGTTSGLALGDPICNSALRPQATFGWENHMLGPMPWTLIVHTRKSQRHFLKCRSSDHLQQASYTNLWGCSHEWLACTYGWWQQYMLDTCCTYIVTTAQRTSCWRREKRIARCGGCRLQWTSITYTTKILGLLCSLYRGTAL